MKNKILNAIFVVMILSIISVASLAVTNSTVSKNITKVVDTITPTVTSFIIGENIVCVATDNIDMQVSVDVVIENFDSKLGTCKAIDDAGNYVIVDQDLNVLEKSKTSTTQVTPQTEVKPVTPVVNETKTQAPVVNTTKTESISNITKEVPTENIVKETNITTEVKDIPMEETVKNITETKKVEEMKKDTKPVSEVVTKPEIKKEASKLNWTMISIALIVLIIASVLAFYMFRKQNEVVIIK